MRPRRHTFRASPVRRPTSGSSCSALKPDRSRCQFSLRAGGGRSPLNRPTQASRIDLTAVLMPRNLPSGPGPGWSEARNARPTAPRRVLELLLRSVPIAVVGRARSSGRCSRRRWRRRRRSRSMAPGSRVGGRGSRSRGRCGLCLGSDIPRRRARRPVSSCRVPDAVSRAITDCVRVCSPLGVSQFPKLLRHDRSIGRENRWGDLYRPGHSITSGLFR